MGNAQSNHDASKAVTGFANEVGKGLDWGTKTFLPILNPAAKSLAQGWSDSKDYVNNLDANNKALPGKEQDVDAFRKKIDGNPFAIYDGRGILQSVEAGLKDEKFKQQVGGLHKQMFPPNE